MMIECYRPYNKVISMIMQICGNKPWYRHLKYCMIWMKGNGKYSFIL